MAPPVGLEPTTLRLTAACSTGWAKEECLCWRLPIVPGRHQPSIFGTNELNFRVRDGNGWTLIVIDTNYSILVVLTGDSHIIAQDIWKCKRFFQFFWKIFYKPFFPLWQRFPGALGLLAAQHPAINFSIHIILSKTALSINIRSEFMQYNKKNGYILCTSILYFTICKC